MKTVVTVSCSNCGSNNLVKAGKTSTGNQIYKCNDCKKRGTFSGLSGGRPKGKQECEICGNPVHAKGYCSHHYYLRRRELGYYN